MLIKKKTNKTHTHTHTHTHTSQVRVVALRLDGLDTKAYDAFQTSRNLKDVVERVIALRTGGAGLKKQLSVRANLMTPILPMLVSEAAALPPVPDKNTLEDQKFFLVLRVGLRRRGLG